MTIILPSNTDKTTLLRLIDAQIQPTPEERAILVKARDAQEALQKLAQLREITVEWSTKNE